MFALNSWYVILTSVVDQKRQFLQAKVGEEIVILAGDLNRYKAPLIDDDEENEPGAPTGEEPKFKFNFDANVDDPVNKKILVQAAQVVTATENPVSCQVRYTTINHSLATTDL